MSARRSGALPALLLGLSLSLSAAQTYAQQIESSQGPASAGELSDITSIPDWMRQIGNDGRTLLSAPLRWDSRTWKRVGLGASTVALLMLADGEVRDRLAAGPYRTPQTALDVLGPLGSEYSWAVLGGFYAAGRATENERAMAIAQDGLTASLIAAGVITPAIKALAGRARPDTDESGLSFLRGGSSFPSGHTTQAFAIASVIASRYGPLWFDVAVYALAAGVGWSRIGNDAHFLSDVVAGALIGVSVGTAVVRIHDERRVAIEPFVLADGGGFTVRASAPSVRALFRGWWRR